MTMEAQTADRIMIRPIALSIGQIVSAIDRLVACAGDSRVRYRFAVNAVHAVYSTLVDEVGRYRRMHLLPLPKGADDSQLDILLLNDLGTIAEVVRVMDSVPEIIIENPFTTDSPTDEPVRYQLIHTEAMNGTDLNKRCSELESKSAVEVFADTLQEWLAYTLRMIDDPADFVGRFIESVEDDTALSSEDKKKWNDVVAGL